MGSGGSTQKQKYSPKVTSPDESIQEESSQDDVHDRIACEWHLTNCLPGKVIMVNSIREAHPFNDEKRVRHKCTGKRHSVATVVDMGPKKVSCNVCGHFIAHTHTSKEFYCCTSCREHGHHLYVCTTCFERGILQKMTPPQRRSFAGPRINVDDVEEASLSSEDETLSNQEQTSRPSSKERKAHPSPRRRRSNSQDETPSDQEQISRPSSKQRKPHPSPQRRRSSRNSLAVPEAANTRKSSKSRSSSPTASTRDSSKRSSQHSKEDVHQHQVRRTRTQVLQSGTWQAEMKEGRTTRIETRLLFFGDGGSLTGTTDSALGKGTIEGAYSRSEITWVETYHAWGTITVEGQINHHVQMDHNAELVNQAPIDITGRFRASDGGNGQLRLTMKATGVSNEEL
eukprot:TRINITY_DN21190_c0_g1_i1.p1 TRINITY_DN21190_c0_g1~~TRINITY_DN21190_c0_g1_i1.p1  ORF type:complete len:398 (-),score=54.87 TRINITY_DN21190_c0_g1_i1:136-1329(-)